MKDDDIKRSKGKFNPITETRDWCMAASEAHCRRIARKTNKRLIEIIDIEDDGVQREKVYWKKEGKEVTK